MANAILKTRAWIQLILCIKNNVQRVEDDENLNLESKWAFLTGVF